MKMMQVRFTTSKKIYTFLKEEIDFDHVDEYITSLIEKDMQNTNY